MSFSEQVFGLGERRASQNDEFVAAPPLREDACNAAVRYQLANVVRSQFHDWALAVMEATFVLPAHLEKAEQR